MVDKIQLEEFVNQHIDEFHNARIKCLEGISLKGVLKKKNPYLFKAKNMLEAGDLISSILDANLSSSEEEIFGQFLEKLAIYIAFQNHQGQKSTSPGIDLEFNKDNIRYLISIKSGPNWGNSSQYRALKDYFKKAKQVLGQNNVIGQPVLGICYGKTRTSNNGDYIKYTGQSFWHFLSDDPNLYTEIIEPIGYEAKKHNDRYTEQKSNIHNKLSRELLDEFCKSSGEIDWNKLVQFNSGNLKL